MPTMKKDPNEVQADYDLKLRKDKSVFEDKDKERDKEVRIAELDLKKFQIQPPVVTQSRHTTVQRIFEIPLRMFALFIVWRLIRKDKKVPEFLKKFI